MRRDGTEYQLLLNRAYECLYRDSESFRDILHSTGNAIITHDVGKKVMSETILTEQEYCDKLMALRDNYGKINI